MRDVFTTNIKITRRGDFSVERESFG